MRRLLPLLTLFAVLPAPAHAEQPDATAPTTITVPYQFIAKRHTDFLIDSCLTH
jgi:hypothetical protein